MLTNGGQPRVEVEDGNFENRGELLLATFTTASISASTGRATRSANLYRAWRRPVNLLTKLDDKGKLLSFDGKSHSERAATF